LFRWFDGRVHHQIPTFLRLRKRDYVTDTLRSVSSSGKDRDQAVDSEGESAMRRSARFESLQQMLHFVRLLSEYLKYFPLHLSIVNANRSPAQFDSIQHKIEMYTCDLIESLLLFYSLRVFFDGSSEWMMAGDQFVLFVSLEQ
ncbi:hypothetical protein PMAYCL1PPCAC_01368, partial [Pristionchus mayeri]